MLLQLLARFLPSKKTRTLARAKPVKKIKPAFEQLEDRLVPSVSFFSDQRGTFAYNHYNNTLRNITALQVKVMANNGGGLLYAGFNSGSAAGTWQYSYDSNRWQKLSALVPVAMSNGAPTLFVSYNTGSSAGTWGYGSGRWTKLTTAVALQIAAIGPGSTYAAFSSGLFQYESYANRWTRINLPAGTTNLHKVAVSGSSLVVSLNTGTWMSSLSGWQKLHNAATTQIAMIGNNDFYISFSFGTYRYNNGNWSNLSSRASLIAANESGYNSPVLVGAWTTGTFARKDNGQWIRLSNYTATFIA